MCGIAAILLGDSSPPLPDWPFHGRSDDASCELPPGDILLETLSRRGPDERGQASVRLPAQHNALSLTLLATTLSLRHAHVPPHPYSRPVDTDDEDKPLLLYNGEIYDILSSKENPGGSDILELYNALQAIKDGRLTDETRTLEAIDHLYGPFSFVYWNPASQRLYFARDYLGRRSLLLASVPGLGTVISSAAPNGWHLPFVEIPPIGLCFIDFQQRKPAFGYVPRHSRIVLPRLVPPRNGQSAQHSSGTYHITRSRCASEINLSFLPNSMLRVYHVAEPHTLHNNPTTGTAHDCSSDDAVEHFLAAFEQSVRRRLAYIPAWSASHESPYAVLFSGGLDSLFLAAMLDRVMPETQPLDLINVAFGKDEQALGACPDRISAVAGYYELRELSSGRRDFRLFFANCSPEEADSVLDNHVRHLVYPGNQPMDASVGTALWIAAQGRGILYSEDGDDVSGKSNVKSNGSVQTSAMQETSARILFSGLGADELMGGYKGRHRTSFRLGGTDAIEKEIDADLSRLWYRNLGRDDRLVADHGREVRHPFLDEDLIRLVTSLPLVDTVCDLSLPDGVGDKLLLRRAAAKIGLPSSAVARPKRAMQFGSRSKQVIERKKDVDKTRSA